MNEYSKNVVRRRHIGKNHTTLGPEYFFRTSAPARIFRPRPAVSGGMFGRDLGPEKIFSRPRVVLYIVNTFREHYEIYMPCLLWDLTRPRLNFI